MNLIDIDSNIAKYVIEENKKQSPFFRKIFNIYLNLEIQLNKEISNGCFQQKLNYAYENTLAFFKLPEAKQEDIYYGMLFK